MIKAKETSIKNMTLFLISAVLISGAYLMARPQTRTVQNLPIFMGDEVLVKKTTLATILNKGVTAAKVETVSKSQVSPAPQPKTVAPLPLFPPTINYKVLPNYPAAALEQGLTGTVVFSIYIGNDGQPQKIETKTSSGIKELDEAAQTALNQWRFSPATQGGPAVASWFEVPVKFEVE